MPTLKSTITIETKVRPCLVGKRKALFHCWANKPDTAVGIVEYNDGSVHEVYPREIKFLDDWVDTFHEHL